MSLTNTAENQIWLLLFNNSDAANIGDAGGLRGSVTAGSLFIALMTADPTDAGTVSEANYTGYARVAVARSGAGFTVSGTNPTTVTNTAAVVFPACTGGSSVVSHFAIMTASTGGSMLAKGSVGSALTVTSGVTPSFVAGALSGTID